MNAFRSLNFITHHPLNRHEPLKALGRVIAWQIATRLRPHAVVVPFVADTRLLVRRGMAGATGNVYCGLHEFEDMGLVLHALRRDDVFVDVGANIGSYTVLAAGAVGCRCLAFEPAPASYAALLDNIRLNNLVSRVDARNEGVGAQPGQLAFTTQLDTVNHVTVDAEPGKDTMIVPVTTLDIALAGAVPSVIKIDVEGFETPVLAGACATLQDPALLALLIELNGSGARYGFDESALHRQVLASGFTSARYDPLARRLQTTGTARATEGNTLYVRDIEKLRARVADAPRYAVRGVAL